MYCEREEKECMYMGMCLHCGKYSNKTCHGKQGRHRKCFVCGIKEGAKIGEVPCKSYAGEVGKVAKEILEELIQAPSEKEKYTLRMEITFEKPVNKEEAERRIFTAFRQAGVIGRKGGVN
ncbi:MAG: hypothetical protein AB9836_07670 [Aminipila sp.]